jgi:hypothetical protein
MDAEALKLFGAIFALFISTMTLEYTLASFINKKRDEFPNRRTGNWNTFGEIYDWIWGYILGIGVNFIFLVIAYHVYRFTQISELSEFSLLGYFLLVFYCINFALWFMGAIFDGFRLKYPGVKQEEQ